MTLLLVIVIAVCAFLAGVIAGAMLTAEPDEDARPGHIERDGY